MEVKILERKLKVFWMYNCLAIPYLAQHDMKASTEKVHELSSMPLKKQILEWNKLYPTNILPNDIKPDTTWCFIMEGDKLLSTASVTRYHKDPENKDKARKYALAKSMRESGFTRDERKVFWIAYLNRVVVIPKKPKMSIV